MSIQIFLDNYNGVCYPGQTIAGRIECFFNKEKNLRAVRIKFKGKAETEWYESESHYNSATKKRETRRVRYSAEETYFEQEYALVQGGDDFVLSQGRHVYPFSYILPQHLPSSFQDTYGKIYYTVKGVIDRPWKFDYEAKIELNILSPLDLNFIPGLRDPLTTSVDKHMCCCWCKSGPLTFDISLPVRGFCPGDQVNIGAYIQNMSNVSAESVKFKIYKDIEFISHYPSIHHRREQRLVVECLEGGIGAHGDKSWTSILSIPTTDVYPNLIPCNIMNITYRLKGKVILPCPHTNLEVEFPCMIGTVPLANVVPSSIGPPVIGAPLPSYDNLTPGPQPMPYPPGPIIGEPTAPRPSDTDPLITFGSGDSKYPPPSQPPYPGANGSPYPNSSHTPTPAAPYPYPPTSGAPYPSTGSPYQATTTPYPPAPSSNEKSPYPGSNPSPYPPPAASAPYASAPADPSAPGVSSAPYPSAGAPYPTSGPYASDTTAPPSYEEAKRQNEKQ